MKTEAATNSCDGLVAGNKNPKRKEDDWLQETSIQVSDVKIQ